MKINRFRGHIAACLVLILTLPAIATAKDLEDYRWLEARTDNFVVRSTFNHEKTVRLLRNLELFRAAAPRAASIGGAEIAVPMVMYLVRNRSDFEALGLDKDMAGIFLPRTRGVLIVLRDVPGIDETSLVFHEYAHLLISNDSDLRLPRWFNEGLAELLSGSEVKLDTFIVGRAPKHRWQELKLSMWLDPIQLLDPARSSEFDERQGSLFYAQSWALVYMLTHRRGRETSVQEDIADYVTQVDAGEDYLVAFENVFDIPGDAINREIRDFFSDGKTLVYKYKISSLIPTFSPRVRQMSRGSVLASLGEAALDLGKRDRAAIWLQEATQHPESLARAETGLGLLAIENGDLDQAEGYFERALVAAPDDPDTNLALARYWSRVAASALWPEERQAPIDKAIESIDRVQAVTDENAESFFLEGKVLLLDGRDVQLAVTALERAWQLYPGSVEIRYWLAQAYRNVGRRDDAAELARSVLSLGHRSSNVTEAAQDLLDQLGASASAE